MLTRRPRLGVGAARLAVERRDSGQAASPRADGGDVGQGVAVELVAHLLADVGPDGEQHALALVVAGAVLVGLAEVAER